MCFIYSFTKAPELFATSPAVAESHLRPFFRLSKANTDDLDLSLSEIIQESKQGC